MATKRKAPMGAEARKFREALEEIANPIEAMRRRLKEGEQLNGHYAVQIANDPDYLRKIAVDALATRARQ